MNISSTQGAGQTFAPVSAPVPSEQLAQQRETIQAVHAVNEAGLYGQNNEVTYTKDPQTRRTVIKIIDRKTQEVIDQIPPEYVLQLAQSLKQTQAQD